VRQHLIAVALLLLASAAHADTKKTSKLHAPIDIRAVVDQLDALVTKLEAAIGQKE
jgi:hypothetical protein